MSKEERLEEKRKWELDVSGMRLAVSWEKELLNGRQPHPRPLSEAARGGKRIADC